MSSSKKLIVGNWKMYITNKADAKAIFRKIWKQPIDPKKVEVVVCPSVVHLDAVSSISIKDKKISIGVQNVSSYISGAHTGECAVSQVKDLGAEYAILGHSECRARGEIDADIAEKVSASLRAGIVPIVCIGESVRDSHGDYLNFVRSQIAGSLAKISRKNLSDLVIAYEPIWAIGKKDFEAITPTDLHIMTIYIRKILSELYGQEDAKRVRILYGGSVNQENAQEIVRVGSVSGLLIGRESI